MFKRWFTAYVFVRSFVCFIIKMYERRFAVFYFSSPQIWWHFNFNSKIEIKPWLAQRRGIAAQWNYIQADLTLQIFVLLKSRCCNWSAAEEDNDDADDATEKWHWVILFFFCLFFIIIYRLFPSGLTTWRWMCGVCVCVCVLKISSSAVRRSVKVFIYFYFYEYVRKRRLWRAWQCCYYNFLYLKFRFVFHPVASLIAKLKFLAAVCKSLAHFHTVWLKADKNVSTWQECRMCKCVFRL